MATTWNGIDRKWVARAARIYRTNDAAAQGLSITPGSFSRLCRTYGIDTPLARRWCDDECGWLVYADYRSLAPCWPPGMDR
jgi:hypothetical protein